VKLSGMVYNLSHSIGVNFLKLKFSSNKICSLVKDVVRQLHLPSVLGANSFALLGEKSFPCSF